MIEAIPSIYEIERFVFCLVVHKDVSGGPVRLEVRNARTGDLPHVDHLQGMSMPRDPGVRTGRSRSVSAGGMRGRIWNK